MSGLDWADDNDEAVQTYKEVGLLAGTTVATSMLFGGIASYSHAKDPVKGGMPGVGPVGADAITGGVALGLAILGGEYVGSMGQTALLGVALGGLGSAGSGWGSKIGVAAFEAMKAKPAGVGQLSEGGVGAQAADILRQYAGS